ncbi:DNA helicase [Tanacetum coccineum]
MMARPCGLAYKNAPCMKDGNKCNRNFPKPYSDNTYIDKDGFVHYRRRAAAIDTERQNVRLDNSYVVPYNRTLCMSEITSALIVSMLVNASIFNPYRDPGFVFGRAPRKTCRLITNPKALIDSRSMNTQRLRTTHVPPRRLLDILQNRILMEERNYDRELLLKEKDSLLPKLNRDQKQIFDEVLNGVKDWQKGKVIGCPTKNETADTINAHVLSLLNNIRRIYLSSDEATPHDNDGGETELLYLNEYLNTLKFAGLSPHSLELKVGVPIILLRNLNLTGGLCNGTRMIVTQLLSKVIEARIITGTRVSEKVFLPRITLINRDLQMPFVFKRKQFPVKLSYAMTINKSQGQSLEKIGIFLPEPVLRRIWAKAGDTTKKGKNTLILIVGVDA